MGTVEAGVEDIGNADGGRWGRQRLQADGFQSTLGIKRDDADSLVLTTDGLEMTGQS